MIDPHEAKWSSARKTSPKDSPKGKSTPSTAAVSSSGLPTDWSSVRWNPPMHRAASGAFIGDSNLDGQWDDGRDGYASQRSRVMGPGDDSGRQAKKGVIFQYRAFENDWSYAAGSQGGSAYNAGSGVDPNIRYGFRFHYNPSTLDFGLAINGTGVNPALIMSGSTSAMPITSGDTSPTIRINLFLNRIEDMALFSRAPSNSSAVEQWKRDYSVWQGKYKKAKTKTERAALLANQPQEPSGARDSLYIPSASTLDYFYGKPNGKTLSETDIRGIYNRGTGYDLEFLFRTLVGKPWSTLLRGDTADVGIAFGVPVIMDLSAGKQPLVQQHGNRYLGRLSSISYSHLSFNTRMVPMWTQVAMDFIRYPDVKGAYQVQSDASGTYTTPYDRKSSDIDLSYLPILHGTRDTITYGYDGWHGALNPLGAIDPTIPNDNPETNLDLSE